MKRTKRRSFKDYFVPHRGNRYKPQIFARDALAVVASVLLLCEAGYLFQIDVLFRNVQFTASVLPGALESLTNADRVSNGVGNLTPDPQLAIAAQNKANDMATKGYFAHVSPEGKTPWYWLDAIGYNYEYAGENLAIDFVDTDQVEKAWMNSPSHHANIVKPEYTNIGIGVAQGMYEGHQTTFVVEMFASIPTVTPVASASRIAQVIPPTKTVQVKQASVATIAAGSASGQVLGVETNPKPILTAPAAIKTPSRLPKPSLIQVAVASPSQTMIDLLLGFIAVVLTLLALSVGMHVRRRLVYTEVAVGGFALAALAGLLLTFNGVLTPTIHLPTDTQSASVALSIP